MDRPAPISEAVRETSPTPRATSAPKSQRRLESRTLATCDQGRRLHRQAFGCHVLKLSEGFDRSEIVHAFLHLSQMLLLPRLAAVQHDPVPVEVVANQYRRDKREKHSEGEHDSPHGVPLGCFTGSSATGGSPQPAFPARGSAAPPECGDRELLAALARDLGPRLAGIDRDLFAAGTGKEVNSFHNGSFTPAGGRGFATRGCRAPVGPPGEADAAVHEEAGTGHVVIRGSTRNRMLRAISSAVPRRPSGILAPAVCKVSSLANFRSPGVSVQPGWITLMRTCIRRPQWRQSWPCAPGRPWTCCRPSPAGRG